jgi:hypothetical protein
VWGSYRDGVGTIQSDVLGPYRDGVLGPYREGQVSALNRMQKTAATFENNMSRVGKFGHSEE